MMKPTRGLFLLLLMTGCTRSAGPARPAAESAAPANAENAPFVLASGLLRQATELNHFREALPLLNSHFDAHAAELRGLSPELRTFLKDEARLDDGEMAEVEATGFRPADAYYLAECFLLRDAAHALEVRGQPPAELARRCFDWVTRNVVLHEQLDDDLPPAFVLRRGHGSARARAEVFLALLRQFQLEGCLLTSAEAPSAVVLAGVLDARSNDLFLFDPRLGVAVTNDRDEPVTLSMARKTPALLQPSGLGKAKLEARLVCPLYALSPRMAELERLLVAQDRVTLALDPLTLRKNVQKTGDLPTSLDDKGPSSMRTLRRFLPPEEGGVDRSGRLKRTLFHQVPYATLSYNLGLLKLTQDLTPPARDMLLRSLGELFDRFYVQPAESTLRGQFDRTLSRLDRIRPFLDTFPPDEREFQREVAAWREELNRAYFQAGKDEREQPRVAHLWAEDEYTNALLRAESDDVLQRAKKKTLTLVLEQVSREPMRQQASRLVAAVWQEKAARAEAVKRRASEAGPAAAAARSAWTNARGAWNRYLDAFVTPPTTPQARLERVRERLAAGDPESALSLLESIHLDLHRALQGRVAAAEATAQLGDTARAAEQLRAVANEIDGLLKDTAIKTSLAAARERLAGLRGAEALYASRVDLLERDGGADGNLAWLGRQVRLRTERLTPR